MEEPPLCSESPEVGEDWANEETDWTFGMVQAGRMRVVLVPYT